MEETCSRETEVLWNSVEKELLNKYGENTSNYKMVLVGVSESVGSDLGLPNREEHFKKFFNTASLPTDAFEDISVDTNFYADLDNILQKQIDKLNKLSFTNVRKLYIEADKKNEYHICALVSEHARNALKAKHYGGEVHLDKNACSWSVKSYHYCDLSCCGQSKWNCPQSGCGVFLCKR